MGLISLMRNLDASCLMELITLNKKLKNKAWHGKFSKPHIIFLIFFKWTQRHKNHRTWWSLSLHSNVLTDLNPWQEVKLNYLQFVLWPKLIHTQMQS